jgi:type IV secretion system protein VirB1
MDLPSLLLACAPLVHPATANALLTVESGHNPFAIGVVGGALERQPRNRAEAIATARQLDADGWDYSVGPAQINRRNWQRLGLSIATAFEPCENLRAMQTILGECYARAQGESPSQQVAVRKALSCYYSGNFTRGFSPDAPGQPSYVTKVVAAARFAPAKTTPQDEQGR